jgi:CRP/FNR family transcriptional regulator, cyclic AMP receptor protein
MPDGFDIAFAALDAPERRSLRALAIARHYERGDVLFHRGDEAGAAHVLLEGRAKVSLNSESGREILVSIAGPGELIGEIAAVAGRPRTATVRALEPVRSLALPANALRAAVQRSSALAMVLLDVAADRLRAADDQRLEFAGQDVLGRVARRLVALTAESGIEVKDGIVLTVALSQEDLASWTAASREAVNRALAQLRGLGCLAPDRRRIVVNDLDALSRYAAL